MTTEEPKRLPPTPTVARNLYGASGNRCAYPGCDTALVRHDGTVVGQIAHIEAAKPGGPRFNPKMDDKERRAPGNLIILCANCHNIIDGDTETWTVEELKSLKTQHEAIYTGAVDVLRRQVGDITEDVTWARAENLGKILDPESFTPQEQMHNIQLVDDLGRRLAKIPSGTRTVLALIISRGDEVDFRRGSWKGEVTIPMAVLKGVASCSEKDLLEHLDVLHHAEIGWFEEVDYGGQQWEYEVGDSTPGVGWKLFAEIKRASGGDAKIVRCAIGDLDFTVLDI